jgi:hypothetical protein
MIMKMGKIAHVRVFADEQRRKAHCNEHDFGEPILGSCGNWAGARPRHFPAGRFHTRFLAVEHGRLVEIGCR